MQCDHVIELYGLFLQTHRWCTVLQADIIGQQEFFYRYGHYPHDQRAFVEAYLQDPVEALC
jgi:hypothetical protein